MPAIDTYLRQAVGILHRYGREPAENPHRWSAAYLPLTNLIGRAFTGLLLEAGELQHNYRYVGQGFPGVNNRNEHVIPLGCVIGHLLEEGQQDAGEMDVAKLRDFLGEHIVMAHVPQALDKVLPASTMPDANWWRPVVIPGFDGPAKQRAMWSRYAEAHSRYNDKHPDAPPVKPLVLPFEGDADFERVATRRLIRGFRPKSRV